MLTLTNARTLLVPAPQILTTGSMMNFFSSNGSNAKLSRVLEKDGGFSKQQVRDVLRQAQNEHRYLTEVLFEQPLVPAQRLLQLLSDHFSLPVVNLRECVISPLVLNLVPKDVAESHAVIPFKKKQKVLKVATSIPENEQTIAFIRKQTGCDIEVYLTTPSDIQHALQLYQDNLDQEIKSIVEEHRAKGATAKDPAQLAEDAPTIRLVNSIIERSLRRNASDIHFEPQRAGIRVRYRIDGLLSQIADIPAELAPALIARVKLLANLKIDEHRIAQDGRFQYLYKGRDVAIRVSMIPTLYGTKVVLRLLDATKKQFTLRKLGFNDHDYPILRNEIVKPQGMILSTGPTGSGKTTTLYTILRMMNKEGVNISTIEDPIEYGIDGINQTQINPAAGLTFAHGLRSLLRQDPNVLMVGEIRDLESAEIAMNAAMTGHIVLSTLHTNSAFLTPQRLREMGVPAFLVASVINVIIGQRLLRRICSDCAQAVRAPQLVLDRYTAQFDYPAMLKNLHAHGLVPKSISLGTVTLWSGKGCPKCNDTGYRGRVCVNEVLRNDAAITRAILDDAPVETIEKIAMDAGVITMVQDAFLKVLHGQTTLAEVSRVMRE